MMNEKDKAALVHYRLLQANELIHEVETLIENDLFRTAINRIYYGMFYALTALALKHDFQSSKHLQLIGWFNKNFIKEKIVPVKYGIILRDALKNRMDGDYAPFVEFKKEDIIILFVEMRDFINRIETLLKN